MSLRSHEPTLEPWFTSTSFKLGSGVPDYKYVPR